MTRTWLLSLFACAALRALPVFGQNGAGTILGTVRDATGASIPAVEITSRRLSTNENFRTVTNEAGDYRLERLPIGEYEIRAFLAGFKAELRKGIRLQVAQTIRVDLALAV